MRGTLVPYRPVMGLTRLSDLDSMLGSILSWPRWDWEKLMPVDVVEKDKSYELKAEMPGFDAKEIEVTLQDGVLTIKAKHASEAGDKETEPKEGESPRYLWRERTSKQVMRRMQLPTDASAEGLQADYANGILAVEIPRLAADKTLVKVPVQAKHGDE